MSKWILNEGYLGRKGPPSYQRSSQIQPPNILSCISSSSFHCQYPLGKAQSGRQGAPIYQRYTLEMVSHVLVDLCTIRTGCKVPDSSWSIRSGQFMAKMTPSTSSRSLRVSMPHCNPTIITWRASKLTLQPLAKSSLPPLWMFQWHLQRFPSIGWIVGS